MDADAFMGEIRAFPYNFVPLGWLLCDGRSLPISEYQALFSILEQTFGMFDRVNFCIPNLLGLAVVGTGPSPFNLGNKGGSTSCNLSLDQLPPHNHILSGDKRNGSDVPLGTATPTDQTFISNSVATRSTGTPPGLFSYSKNGNKALNDSFMGYAGSGLPHDNMMPYLTFQYCICYDGLYPRRY